MNRIKLLVIIIFVLSSCNLKEDNKQKMLEHLRESKSEEGNYQEMNYEGSFTEPNKEKIRIGGSDYFIVLTFDEVLLTIDKDSKTTIKKDEYSQGEDYQNYEIDFLVTMENTNNQYFQFTNKEFSGLWLGTGVKAIYTASHPDYDVLWSKDKRFIFEVDESNKYKLEFRAGVNESMKPLYVRGFYTRDDVGNDYEVLFEIDFKTRQIIDKVFLRKEDSFAK